MKRDNEKLTKELWYSLQSIAKEVRLVVVTNDTYMTNDKNIWQITEYENFQSVKCNLGL